MTTTATHNAHDNTPERVLCVAFARREKAWKLGCTTGHGQQPRERTVAARQQGRVLQEVAQAKRRCGLPDTAPVVRGDAAGREGCWRHRFFQAQGRTTHVVDASSIAVKRRQRRAKSEGLAGRKLLRMLRRYPHGARNVWRGVHVPSVAAEDQRQLPRALETLQQERARTTTRLQGVLSRQGGRLTRRTTVPAPLDTLRRWEGAPLPSGRHRRVLRVDAPHQLLRAQMAAGDAERRALRHSAPAAHIEPVRQWMPLRGIGSTGAWWLVREFFGWRAVTNRRAVGGVAGGTPPPYHSGASARAHGMTKSGHRHGRGMTTAVAWSWRRYQPERALRGWCRERFSGGGKRLRRLGSVAGARKFRMALWRFLDTGVIPAGAARKEASAVLRCCVPSRSWSWWRRPVGLPGLAQQPSERWGRLPQVFQRSSHDAESIG